MDELNLEDLAMGKLPKKNKKGEKPMPLGDKVKSKLKKVESFVNEADAASVKTFKGYNKSELKALCKAYNELQDTLYRLKDTIRAAMPKDDKGGYNGM